MASGWLFTNLVRRTNKYKGVLLGGFGEVSLWNCRYNSQEKAAMILSEKDQVESSNLNAFCPTFYVSKASKHFDILSDCSRS